jgi:hypothetical protein
MTAAPGPEDIAATFAAAVTALRALASADDLDPALRSSLAGLADMITDAGANLSQAASAWRALADGDMRLLGSVLVGHLDPAQRRSLAAILREGNTP